jgi:hypothetical protein
MMSNIPEDVLLTEGERFKVLMEHTEDAFEDDQQNDALAIAQAQLDKAMRILKDSGWLSPEQVRERNMKIKALLNTILSHCSERSARWRAVTMELESLISTLESDSVD